MHQQFKKLLDSNDTADAQLVEHRIQLGREVSLPETLSMDRFALSTQARSSASIW